MKVKLITGYEYEEPVVEIKCKEVTKEVENVINTINKLIINIPGKKDGETFILKLDDIYYFETDTELGQVNLYTKKEKLKQIECFVLDMDGTIYLGNQLFEFTPKFLETVKKVVALSTDKAVNPVNLYGGTKLVSDKLFIAANAYAGTKDINFSIVRYGNVAGSRGSVIPLWIDQIRAGNPITITDGSMTRFIMSLEEAVENLKRSTRRYAKRQLTWFNKDTRINWIYKKKS